MCWRTLSSWGCSHLAIPASRKSYSINFVKSGAEHWERIHLIFFTMWCHCASFSIFSGHSCLFSGEVEVLSKGGGATLMCCWPVCYWWDLCRGVMWACLGSSFCRNVALIVRSVARVLRDLLLCPPTCSSTQTHGPIPASIAGRGSTRNLIWRNTPSFTQVSPAGAAVQPQL